MYFKRLKIKDFGPIREIEFNFEKDKVYHFIGDNDSGKSMILDAMNILCNNIAGIHVKKYVSDFAESFFIEAEDFEGNIIQLKRGAESWYNLIKPDGTELFYDKIGGDVPVTIENIVNTYVDDIKKEKFNFRYSDDKILFMNTTAGENYSFFQKALRTDKVLNALKHANKTQNSMDKELDITRSKVEFERDKLDSNPDITYIKEEVNMYREAIKDSLETTRTIYEVITGKNQIEKLGKLNIPSEITEFNWETQRDNLTVIKNTSDILEKTKRDNQLKKSYEQSQEVQEVYEQIASMVKQQQLILELNNLYSQYNNSSLKSKSIETISEQITKLESEAETLESIKTQINAIEIAQALKRKEHTLDSVYTKLDTIEEVYKQQNEQRSITVGIKSLIDELERLRDQDKAIEENIVLTEKLEEDKNEYMRQNNFCPVVVNSLNKRCPFSNKTLEELMGAR